ncbi:hypothetical protein TNCV_4354581 [Trichonephila clavipes]|nr:hypothetical protein TNCV_4354581 [Trichonephila clavipes]
MFVWCGNQEEECHLRAPSRHLTMAQNWEANIPRVASSATNLVDLEEQQQHVRDCYARSTFSLKGERESTRGILIKIRGTRRRIRRVLHRVEEQVLFFFSPLSQPIPCHWKLPAQLGVA